MIIWDKRDYPEKTGLILVMNADWPIPLRTHVSVKNVAEALDRYGRLRGKVLGYLVRAKPK